MSFSDTLLVNNAVPTAWSNMAFNSITVGATGATGTFFQTAHLVSGVTGVTSSGTINISLSKVGNVVAVTLGPYSSTAGTTGTISTTVAIPVVMRPLADCYFPVCTVNGGSYANGCAYFAVATGLITFYPTAYFTNWAGGGTVCGILGGGVVYNSS